MSEAAREPTGADRPAPVSPYVQVAGLVGAMGCIALGNGLITTFVPIRLDAADFTQGRVGIVVTAYAVGLLLGCLLSGRLVRGYGHVRAFTALAALGTISTLLLAVRVDLGSWTVLRLAGGFCTTGMFMTAQSWLNAVTLSQWRGRVMALFYVTYTMGLALGALTMNRIDIAGPTALMLLAGLYAAAVVPVALTRLTQPAPPERINVDLRRVYRVSPVGLAGAFVSGGLGMTMMGVGPMYGTAVGLAPAAIALAMAALQGGNLVIQWPLGGLSDRIDRRRVILGAAGGVGAVSLAVLGAGPQPLWLLAALFAVWGGLAESLYTVATAHANDHAEADDYVMVSSTILVVWATGATVGPALATLTLERFGPDGLWGFFALEAALFAGFVAWRMTRRVEPETQESFQAWPASSPPIPEWSPYAPEEYDAAHAADEPAADDSPDDSADNAPDDTAPAPADQSKSAARD